MSTKIEEIVESILILLDEEEIDIVLIKNELNDIVVAVDATRDYIGDIENAVDSAIKEL